MRRREFIALASASAAWPFAALAQEPGRTYRLGCLLPRTRDAPINAAFFDELRRRGFIEGQNLTVEYRAYGLHPDLISQYAVELVKARVDVIITGGDEATRALQQATKTIPISTMSGDMLEYGFVNSLAQPDGNTTGVSILAIDLDGKRQDILIEAVPGLRRMAALVADDVKNTPAKLDALQQAAHAPGRRAFNPSCCQRRPDRRSDRARAGIGRQSAKHPRVSPLVRERSPDYGARRRTPHTGDVFLSRRGRGRCLCRLRTAQYSAFYRSTAPTGR